MTEVKRKVTKAEWDQRVNLAACYRLVAMYGWDDLVFTHISARVPGPEHHFLINPYGMTFAEVTASSLVKVNLAGNKVMKSPFDINPAGFVIHSAIHAAREDAICVLHTHSLNGTAVSAQEQGILPLSQKSTFVLASLAYHDYEGLAVSADEKIRLVRDLGDKRFLMLRNHGLITVGETVADAFLFMYQFEAACAIQVRAQTSSGKFVLINSDVLATVSKRLKEVLRGTGGSLVWPALLRTLNQSDKSYRS